MKTMCHFDAIQHFEHSIWNKNRVLTNVILNQIEDSFLSSEKLYRIAKSGVEHVVKDLIISEYHQRPYFYWIMDSEHATAFLKKHHDLIFGLIEQKLSSLNSQSIFTLIESKQYELNNSYSQLSVCELEIAYQNVNDRHHNDVCNAIVWFAIEELASWYDGFLKEEDILPIEDDEFFEPI